MAGNRTLSGTHSVSIDRTPPVVSITVPAEGAYFIVGEAVDAEWTATDALSGVASATVPSASGSPIDTATPGTAQFTVVVLDRAGNQTTVSRNYEVVSPAAAAGRLSEIIAESGIEGGVGKALTGDLEKVEKDLAAGRFDLAHNTLNAFMNQVSAQAGKKIDTALAAFLIAEATRLANANGS